MRTGSSWLLTCYVVAGAFEDINVIDIHIEHGVTLSVQVRSQAVVS